jgi:hypothetical protein
MNLRALLLVTGLSVATLIPAYANDRPQSTNPNVKRAMKTKKAKKVRPVKYKAPKKAKKPAHATYGVH